MNSQNFNQIPYSVASSILNSVSLSSNNNISKSKRYQKKQPWYKDATKHLYAKIVLWTFGMNYSKEFQQLIERMSKMYKSQSKRKNLRMPFQYFKDCFTILQFLRAGKRFTSFKHFIRIDKKGYPKIIPHVIRLKLYEGDRRLFLAVSTLFGVYRVIPWWPDVSFKTITDPFSGKSETLDMSLLLRGYRNILSYASLSQSKLWKIQKPVFLDLRRSSPNGETSVFASWLDAIAFWGYPKLIVPFYKWNYELKAYNVLISFSLLLILGYPYYLYTLSSRGGFVSKIAHLVSNFLFSIGYWEEKIGASKSDPVNFAYHSELWMGKLAVVTDQTGKSRIVGITNYWLQVSLKPIHDLILSLLKVLPTDGTYNQLKPVLDLPCGNQYSSYDLTAATDRLPIKVQEQVLSLLIGKRLASIWRELLDIPFSYDDYEYKYEVGQPMGAYSSWAVMALTHHVLIASLFKKGEVPLYAVLGDDMCIDPKKGQGYLNILDILGVSVSLVKSLEFSYYVEFAKKLINKVNNSVDAIIGPKLIMRAIEDKYLRYNLLYEAHIRELIDTNEIFGYLDKVNLFTSSDLKKIEKFIKTRKASKVVEAIKCSKNYLKRKNYFIEFGRFILFGTNGLIVKNRHYALKSGLMSGNYLPIPDSPRHRTVIFEIYSSKWMQAWENNRKISWAILKRLPLWVSKRVKVEWPAMYPYAFILFLLSPAFWVPLNIFIRDAQSDNPSYNLRGTTHRELSEATNTVTFEKIKAGIHDRLFDGIEDSPYISSSFDLTIEDDRKGAIATFKQMSAEWDIREKGVIITERTACDNGIFETPILYDTPLKEAEINNSRYENC